MRKTWRAGYPATLTNNNLAHGLSVSPFFLLQRVEITVLIRIAGRDAEDTEHFLKVQAVLFFLRINMKLFYQKPVLFYIHVAGKPVLAVVLKGKILLLLPLLEQITT